MNEMGNSWIIRSVFMLAAVAAPIVCPAAADEPCRLSRVAKLPMTALPSGHISVPMTVGGKALNMLVDTGGVLSMLSPEAVASLGLTPEPVSSMANITQFGGLRVDRYVTARDVTLENLKAGTFKFLVMPRGGYAPEEDGLLGPDVLSGFDADFDFANASLSLFQPNECSHDPIYWTHEPYAEVDVSLDDARQIRVPVTIDGRKFEAFLDTGASETVARLEKFEDEFNIDKRSLNLVDGARPVRPRYRYPFKSLSFEGVMVNNPDIVLVPDSQSKQYHGPDLLLGMNVLRKLHVYIAYGQRKLYLTSANAH